MFERLVRVRVILSMAALLASPAAAQVTPPVPPPAQAQQMLQNNPQLIQQLQQMMRASGMTPDQIRARLRAQGYPDSLLDQYLPGGRAPTDSTVVPSDDVFAAIRKIGIVDTMAVDSLRTQARRRRDRALETARARDSAFLDTLTKAIRANDTTAEVIRTLLRSRDKRRDMLDSGFTIYGLGLFDKENTQLDANTVGGADPNYRIGPGDQLTLVLTGDVEKTYSRLTVSRDGLILIPDAGVVNVAGKSLAQLTDLLYDRLRVVYSGVRRGAGATTRFYVDLAQIGNNQVYVNGDVVKPGSYRPSRAGTVMTALHMAGGPTPTGSLRKVEVRRGGELMASLDIYDYALRGDLSGDVRLENNDVVFVPPRGPQVRVAGHVLRPATYEIIENETISQVIRMAGGFSADADRRRVQIERIVPPPARTAE